MFSASKVIVREVLAPIARAHIEEIRKNQVKYNWDVSSVNSTISGINEILSVFDDKLPSSYESFVKGLSISQLYKFKEVIEKEISMIQDAEKVSIYAVEDKHLVIDYHYDKKKALKQQISLIEKAAKKIDSNQKVDDDDMIYMIRPYRVSIESLDEYFENPDEAKKYFEAIKNES